MRLPDRLREDKRVTGDALLAIVDILRLEGDSAPAASSPCVETFLQLPN